MQPPDFFRLKERRVTHQRVEHFRTWINNLSPVEGIVFSPKERGKSSSPGIRVEIHEDGVKAYNNELLRDESTSAICYTPEWFVDALANDLYRMPPRQLPRSEPSESDHRPPLEEAALDGMAMMINADPSRWIDNQPFSSEEIAKMLQRANKNHMVDVRSNHFWFQIGESKPLSIAIPSHTTRNPNLGEPKHSTSNQSLAEMIGSDILTQIEAPSANGSTKSMDRLTVSKETETRLLDEFSKQILVAATDLQLINSGDETLKDRLAKLQDRQLQFLPTGVELTVLNNNQSLSFFLPYAGSEPDPTIAHSNAFPLNSVGAHLENNCIPRALADFVAFCKDLGPPEGDKAVEPLAYLPTTDGPLVQFIDTSTQGNPSVVYRHNKDGKLQLWINNKPVPLNSNDLGDINSRFGGLLLEKFDGQRHPMVVEFQDLDHLRQVAFEPLLPHFPKDKLGTLIECISTRQPIRLQFGNRTHRILAFFEAGELNMTFNDEPVSLDDRHFQAFIASLIPDNGGNGQQMNAFLPSITNADPDKSAYLGYLAELYSSSTLFKEASQYIFQHGLNALESGTLYPVDIDDLKRTLVATSTEAANPLAGWLPEDVLRQIFGY